MGGSRDRSRKAPQGVALAVALAACAALPASAAPDDLILVSRASGFGGAAANRASSAPSLSADGRLVAFESAASNLSSFGNTIPDVFVRDSIAGTTTLVTRGAHGLFQSPESREPSGDPAISADGRVVAFASAADNLSTSDADGVRDVFVGELGTGAITLVSRGSGIPDGPAGTDDSGEPAISGDGGVVAFTSEADNIAANDNNGVTNVYVRNLSSHTTVLASRASSAGDGDSTAPAVSADGRLVAFTSAAGNLSDEDAAGVTDVFVRDVAAGTTTLVSRATGLNGAAAGGSSRDASISADGRLVAFASDANDLSGEDDDGVTNVFVRDLVAGTTTLVSRATDGAAATGSSTEPVISADGRHVAFRSTADNLSSSDVDSVSNVYVRDLATGETSLISRATGAGGRGATGASSQPALSGDGRLVAFTSAAQDLSSEDGPEGDVFLRDHLGSPGPAGDPDAPPAPPDPTTPSLTLTTARVIGAFGARALSARLVVRGTSTGAAATELTLRRTTGPRATGMRTAQSLVLRVTGAGPFTARLALSTRLAPGRYALAAPGVNAAPSVRTVVIDRPPRGVLRDAFVSAAQNGPPALVLPRRTRALFCHFVFAVPPTRKPITTEWSGPGVARETTVRRPGTRVIGFLRTTGGPGFAPARYSCILRVAGKRLASVSARVR
jgi:Tol biopolymer transport system component